MCLFVIFDSLTFQVCGLGGCTLSVLSELRHNYDGIPSKFEGENFIVIHENFDVIPSEFCRNSDNAQCAIQSCCLSYFSPKSQHALN